MFDTRLGGKIIDTWSESVLKMRVVAENRPKDGNVLSGGFDLG